MEASSCIDGIVINFAPNMDGRYTWHARLEISDHWLEYWILLSLFISYLYISHYARV